MNVRQVIATQEAEKGFYPTPAQLADKLLEGINWYHVHDILEPSAGKGDLIQAVLRNAYHYDENRYQFSLNKAVYDVDAIEIDPYLRSILAYEFSEAKKKEYEEEDEKARTPHPTCSGTMNYATDEAKERHEKLREKIMQLESISVRIIHDDFLTCDTRKRYDLIVMNPPFSDGDAHLLKAIEMQRRYGGKIRCILNAETLLNPYTNRRKVLQAQLQELGAEIEYVDGRFSDAEQRTEVTVALIKLSLPVVSAKRSEFFERMQKAAGVDESAPADVTDLSPSEFIAQITARFNVEVDTGLALMREFEAASHFVSSLALGLRDEHSTHSNLYAEVSVNQFLKEVRIKYWQTLFDAPQFTAKLTSNLREKYRGMVRELSAYDFTEYNIRQIVAEMNAEMGKGIEETILALFDDFTARYSYYPEMSKNIHYYNGWKSNKAHKVEKKVIVPIYGFFADRTWSKEAFRVQQAEGKISDIEKVFDYLDGNMTAEVDLHGVLKQACNAGQTRNIQCKYFSVSLFRKGTMHIKFTNLELLDRFNIYCGKGKNWLPPSYGKAAYSDLSQEEKAVADSFHGDGTEGSGQKAYTNVYTQQQYYLADPVSNTLALSVGN